MISITFFTCNCYYLARMQQQFWNQRYSENEWVYGRQPNEFFKRFIDNHKAGTLLLPAEGEGRNALYAASKGWQVDAFDFSDVAKEKALQQAKNEKLNINYRIQEIETFTAGKQYDAVALIYVHLPQEVRKNFHREIYKAVKSGGFLVMEAFAKEQIYFNSGGPKDPAMLYDAPSICSDFPFLHLLSCGQKEVELNEGNFHKGKAAVLQMTGQKL